MSGRPKVQHWVPRFYLKHFATEDTRRTSNPKVWVINKDQDSSEPELMTTKRICGQRYLYTPEGEDGIRDWSLDDYLTGLESDAAIYWDALSSAQLDLSEPETRNQVAEFLAALHLRNKFVLDLYKGVMETRDALFGEPDPTQRVAREKDNDDRPDPTHPGRFFAQSTRNNMPSVKRSFMSFRWTLLTCEHNALITSDVPVVFIDSLPRRSGPGAKDPKAIFPVSPSTMLYMERCDGRAETIYKEIDGALFRRINQVIAYQAERFVVLGCNPCQMEASWGYRRMTT